MDNNKLLYIKLNFFILKIFSFLNKENTKVHDLSFFILMAERPGDIQMDLKSLEITLIGMILSQILRNKLIQIVQFVFSSFSKIFIKTFLYYPPANIY